MEKIVHAVVMHCKNHPDIRPGDSLSIDSGLNINSTIMDDGLNDLIISEAIRLLKRSRKTKVHLCYDGEVFVSLNLIHHNCD